MFRGFQGLNRGCTNLQGTFSVDLTALCRGFRAAERATVEDLEELRPESIYVAWCQWLSVY